MMRLPDETNSTILLSTISLAIRMRRNPIEVSRLEECRGLRSMRNRYRGSPTVGQQGCALTLGTIRHENAPAHTANFPLDAIPAHRKSPAINGGSGIRTHGSLRISGFQDRCNKPLYHPSNLLNLNDLQLDQ